MSAAAPLPPLLESLQHGFTGLPPALLGDATLAAARRDALDAAVRDGLPGPRLERWKYTSLRAMQRRRFALPHAIAVDETALAAIPAPRLVFVNGVFDVSLSQCDSLPDGVRVAPLSRLLAEGDATVATVLAPGSAGVDDAFAQLNVALATDGVCIDVDADVAVGAPLHLVFVGAAADADVAWHLASRIRVGTGAALEVVEHHLAVGAHGHLGNARMRIDVAEGARLAHARLQDEAHGASLFTRTAVRLAAAAHYRRLDLELGAALSRHELDVRLEGEGAALVANGVLLADHRRHLDTRLGIEHVAGDTSCVLNWRGLGAAQGRAVFHGGITIHEGADGSVAELSNKNLLLSDEAEVDTQPVLVIHADEVRAAHGATVGQLDPAALFYLRSRGLQADDARRLLTVAFCREPLEAIEDSALIAQLAAHVDARLHAGGAL